MTLQSIRNRFLLSWTLILLALLPLRSFAADGKTALVIIDMQPIFVTRGGNDKTPENIEKVNQITLAQIGAIEAAKAAKVPIIFLEYKGYEGTNDSLKNAVKDYKDVSFFLKTSDGMLDNYNAHKQELVKHLTENKIGTLIITGANGGACVQQSINGALNANYSVVAYTKGIADFNYREFMYPYKYGTIKPSCKDCTFREVDDLKGVFASGNSPLRENEICATCTNRTTMPEVKSVGDLRDQVEEVLQEPARNPNSGQRGLQK